MKTLFLPSVLALSLPFSLTFAGTMGDLAKQDANPFYFILGTGYSWSDTVKLNPDLSFWDPAVEGYSSDFGSTMLYNFGVGYRFNKMLGLSIEAAKRSQYHYTKLQTSLGIHGNKTRNFNVDNTTIMMNGQVFGEGISDSLLWALGSQMTLQPTVGGGLGVAYNTLSNFYSTRSITEPLYGQKQLGVFGNNTKISSLACQLQAGLHFTYGTHASVDIGYRYFSGGMVKGPDVITYGASFVPPIDGSASRPFVNDRFQANEAFINLNYAL